MTRIAYLTDTHIGCEARGYHRQPRYLEKFPALMQALRTWLARTHVDLLVHGGDVVDHGTPSQIQAAVEQFGSLDLPVAIALGNHDLAQPSSMNDWRRLAGELVAGGDDQVLCHSLDHCDVLLLTHHWQPDRPYHWTPKLPQQPRLDAMQEAALCRQLTDTNRPAILAIHAPVHAIPPDQSGLAEPVHLPDPDFAASLERIARQYPNLRLVMTGHNHIHSIRDHGTFVSCSTAAFSERPGELRLIEVDEQHLRIQTISLAGLADLPDELNLDLAWVLGDATDRSFAIPLGTSAAIAATCNSRRTLQ